MFCQKCGAEINGQFCSKCGAKAIDLNENKSNQSEKTVQVNAPKEVSYYIKMFFWWFWCVCLIVSGIAILLEIDVIAGIVMLIGGLIICPVLLNEYSVGIRLLISFILYAVGGVLIQ